ncbi:MAG: hypothetical protein A2Y34_17690 [Spirochaetes bacterium GWC1_27_15]|nr:MAG: hypothetical protein A2Y34_17690 [Spirochaetes bacterium GWC1_27_15]
MNYGMRKDEDANFFNDQTLVVNSNNKIVKNILSLSESSENEEKIKNLVNQIYDLALLSQNNLKGDRLVEFVKRSNSIMSGL